MGYSVPRRTKNFSNWHYTPDTNYSFNCIVFLRIMDNDDAIDWSLTSGGLRSAQYSKTLSEELLNIGMPRPTKNISSL